MFVLQTLINKYGRKGALFACFVDFRRAFDTVLHNALLFKLLDRDIRGPFYRIIKSMYTNSSLQVKVDNQLSASFTSHIGVRQGDVLSPNLFKLFISDIDNYFSDSCDPAEIHDVKINCLSYADDIILLSRSANGLRSCLDNHKSFSDDWGMQVNIKKTKVVIFSKNKYPHLDKFPYGSAHVDVVDNYKYLGVHFSKNGSSKTAHEQLYKKGLKSYFRLCKTLPTCTNNPNTFLHLFDHIVKPCLLYGSEIWGIDSNKRLKEATTIETLFRDIPAEKIHMKACRFTLGVHKYTSLLSLYGELGRYPLYLDIIISITKYWLRILSAPKGSLLQIAYDQVNVLMTNGSKTWLNYVQHIFHLLNLSHLYESPKSFKPTFIIQKVSANLKIYIRSQWKTKLFDDTRKNNSNNKLRTYRKFKYIFTFEKYLNIIKDAKSRKALTQFRTSSHSLNIEKGRHRNIPVGERTCPHCPESVENEEHFLVTCTKYSEQRKDFFACVNERSKWFTSLSNNDRFIFIMSNEDPCIIEALAKFIYSSMEIRKTLI